MRADELMTALLPAVGEEFQLPARPGLPVAAAARVGVVDGRGPGRITVRLKTGHRWRLFVRPLAGGVDRIEAAQSVRAIADIIADLKRSKNHPALRERAAASWRDMSAWHGHLADVLATRLTARGK